MKKEFKRRVISLFGILAVLWSAVGCGNEETAGDGVWQRKERVEHDLTSGGWKEPEETADSSEPWQATDYWECLSPGTAVEGMRYAGRMHTANGSEVLLLERFVADRAGAGAQKYFLTCLDTLTMEAEIRELSFSAEAEGGQEADAGREDLQMLAAELNKDLNERRLFITGMSGNGDEICIFAHQWDQEAESTVHYYVLWMDRQGHLASAVDLLPEIKRSGMEQGDVLPDGIVCDKEGRFYIGEEKIGLFDSNGKFLKLIEASDGSGNQVFCTGRLPDGRLVFEHNTAGGGVAIFCLEGLEEKVLYQGSGSISAHRNFSAFGEILYMESGKLLRWDAAEGGSEVLYSDSGLAALGMDCDEIIENSAEEVVLLYFDGNTSFAFRLRLGADMPVTDITVFAVSGSGKLEAAAKEYCWRHPGVRIQVENRKEGEDFEAAMVRLTGQLSQGKGPDMFLLPIAQLESFSEQGILADLSGVLTEEMEAWILPKVLQGGMVGGKLYGIVDAVSVNTVIVSEKIWQEETWTAQDVMRLTEENGYTRVFGRQSPAALLYSLVAKDVAAGNSDLVDLSGRRCSFDSEEFIELLEFCKKYGTPPEDRRDVSLQEEREEAIRDVKEGRTLAYCSNGSLMNLSSDMAAFGDGYRCVGYPTDGDYGSYVEYYDCYGVNADSPNKEAAYDFLRYVLGERNQRKTGITTIRKDILCNNVADGAQPGESPVFWCDRRTVTPLEGRSDGSSFLPEYLEILEKGGWTSAWADTLGMIISEEAASYFSGDKTAEAAAEVIQRRAQIYLNE